MTEHAPQNEDQTSLNWFALKTLAIMATIWLIFNTLFSRKIVVQVSRPAKLARCMLTMNSKGRSTTNTKSQPYFAC